MSNDLVFQFKCLSGVADLNVHDFVSFFISRAVPRTGPCVPFALGLLCPVRTRPIVSPTFFVCFSLSMNFFAVSCIFDFYGILYCCTSIIWVIPNKTVKKINRRSVPPLSRALLGQLNIAWSQEKLSHCKWQCRYPITRFQFLQISQHYTDRGYQQIMQMCLQYSEYQRAHSQMSIAVVV